MTTGKDLPVPTTKIPQGPPPKHLHPIWSPADYHETFARAATFQAELAASVDEPVQA